MKPSVEGLAALTWVKSSYSTNDGPDCVEVAHTTAAVLVRDSKRPEYARLAVTPAAWSGFVAHAVTS
ncbi:DUF397 domain-containing protein [Streptomyces nojiriensis]|uniref:DUF397 domain-containing protein n=1 Tax=Streptomyces nojiriensis TaxID=66374 RepID=UPI0035D7CF1E